MNTLEGYYKLLSRHGAAEAQERCRFFPQRVSLYKRINRISHRPLGYYIEYE